MKSRKNVLTHYSTNIVEVMENKSILNKMTFVYTPDECYYLDNGVKLKPERVKTIYPTTLLRKDWNNLDPDSRKIS
jgi:hypothetical protein